MSDTNFKFSSSQDIYDYTIGIKVYPDTVVRAAMFAGGLHTSKSPIGIANIIMYMEGAFWFDPACMTPSSHGRVLILYCIVYCVSVYIYVLLTVK